MNEQLLVSLLLVALVAVDAIGDAFRLRKWNIPHHALESIHVAGWIGIWAAFGFDWHYITMYVAGRIVLFDIVFNLTAGLPIAYVGENSIYDLIIKLFGGWVKQNPGHFAFIFRAMALTVWIATLIKIT